MSMSQEAHLGHEVHELLLGEVFGEEGLFVGLRDEGHVPRATPDDDHAPALGKGHEWRW